jgi:hypothetical protein
VSTTGNDGRPIEGALDRLGSGTVGQVRIEEHGIEPPLPEQLRRFRKRGAALEIHRRCRRAERRPEDIGVEIVGFDKEGVNRRRGQGRAALYILDTLDQEER